VKKAASELCGAISHRRVDFLASCKQGLVNLCLTLEDFIMKPHQHALISIGYGVAVSLMVTGNLAGDPTLYLAALLGGESIDVLDHSLYHLVYRRNQPDVVEARKVLREKGVKAFAHTLKQVEDSRGFTGLLLHNIYAFISLILLILGIYLVAPGQLMLLTS
jgi:hypothetical protein